MEGGVGWWKGREGWMKKRLGREKRERPSLLTSEFYILCSFFEMPQQLLSL